MSPIFSPFHLLGDGMEQMSLYFEGQEFEDIKGIVPRCYKKVRRKYSRVNGESVEDFKNFIVTETLLEISEELKCIALYRQNLNIELKYGKDYDGK